MYQHLTECKTHAENLQISFYFCKTCIYLKILENIQITENMIDRLHITDGFSVKWVFNLNTIIFIDAALNISLRKFWKCNVLWFYLFGQGVPNETKLFASWMDSIIAKRANHIVLIYGRVIHHNYLLINIKLSLWPISSNNRTFFIVWRLKNNIIKSNF